MQGRPRQGNKSWDRETSARFAELASRQGTGQHRPLSTSTGKHGTPPSRPPTMPPHLDSRPEMTPRAPRPQHEVSQPRRVRPFLIVLGAIVAIIVIIVFVIVFVLSSALNQSAGPSTTAVDFVSSLETQSYDNAYNDLSTGLKLMNSNQQAFTQQAQNLDKQYGNITDYKEDSSTVDNNKWTFTYIITRAKLTKPYKLVITLQQNPNDPNNWQVVDYGLTLGPTQS